MFLGYRGIYNCVLFISFIIPIIGECPSVVDLDGVCVQTGNFSQISSVQNGTVLTHMGFVTERNETGIAVRNVHNGSSQGEAVENVRGILDGTNVYWCDSGEYLAGDVCLNGQWNVTQIQMSAVRVGIEEGQIDTFMTVILIEQISIKEFDFILRFIKHLRKVIGGGVIIVVDFCQYSDFVDDCLDNVP